MPPALALVVFVLQTIALAGPALWALERWFTHARRAGRARRTAERSELIAGETAVIGTVETDLEAAITVVVHEIGTEQRGRGFHTHMWLEKDREVSISPFVLRTAGGESIEVEADARTQLVAEIHEVERPFPEVRTRRARLLPGERVTVDGLLVHEGPARAGPYRGGTTSSSHEGWRLCAPPRARLICATGSLSAGHERMVRFWRWSALAMLAAAVYGGAMFGARYLQLLVYGVPVEVELTGVFTSDSQPHHAGEVVGFVRGGAHDGRAVSDTLTTYARGSVRVGSRVPFVIVPGDPIGVQFGSRASLAWSEPLGFLVYLLFVAFALYAARIGSLPWYEHTKIRTIGIGSLTPAPRA